MKANLYLLYKLGRPSTLTLELTLYGINEMGRVIVNNNTRWIDMGLGLELLKFTQSSKNAKPLATWTRGAHHSCDSQTSRRSHSANRWPKLLFRRMTSSIAPQTTAGRPRET